jgi:hypothetical protein
MSKRLDYIAFYSIYIPTGDKRARRQEPPHVHVVDSLAKELPSTKFWLNGKRLGWDDEAQTKLAIPNRKDREKLRLHLERNSIVFQACFHWLLNQEINGRIEDLYP